MENLPVILIVDDNPSNLELLFEVLDQKGFEVLVSQSGEYALKRAEFGQPDLILLDIMMPGLDGFETCQRLKDNAKTSAIPVIFMTALTEIIDKVKGFDLGAVDYITKPFQPEEVLARVTTHLTMQRLQKDLQMKNEALAAALEREKELNRLKSRFISMISHEFKTPLTTILLSSNILRRYGERMSAEKRGEELAVIEKTVDYLNRLLEDVLMIAKGEAGKLVFRPEMTDISQLCRKLVERFRAANEESHTIEFAPGGENLQVVVDSRLLEHILSNLLSNAVKYSPAGGTIRFELSKRQNELCFRVTDEGIGISAADQPHLFETFHRGENVGTIKGTGLGLSIVKQFVELHSGAISVASELGKGTTAVVVIPYRTPGEL